MLPPDTRDSSAALYDDPLPSSNPAWRKPRTDRSGPGSPATNAPPPATGPCATAQFVLDACGIVLAARIDEADRRFYGRIDTPGQSLRDALTALRSDWHAILPPSLTGDNSPVFLPTPCPDAPAIVLALYRIHCDDRTHITLAPELAPAASLRKTGLADFTPDPATLAKLFLRLRAVDSRLDHYLAHLPGVVFHQRADLTFAFIGPGCEKLFGLAPQTLSKDSHTLLRLIHPEDERNYYLQLDHHAASDRPFSLVYRVLHPDTGAYAYILDARSPVQSSGGMLLGYEGVWLDITQQKILEHRLATRSAQARMSALTDGLLHDLGDVMTGISSLSDLYQGALAVNHPLRDGLALLRANASQARELAGHILSLNRERTGESGYVDLATLIRGELALLHRVLPREAHLSAALDAGECPVHIDDNAFRQILVELTLNARDALRGSGDISIALRRLPPGETPAPGATPALGAIAQPSVELIFSDTGCGISSVHLPHIFAPFFSTKDGRHGTGLGLYQASQFAQEHGGAIAARSTLNRGTEIIIVLPLADLSVTPSTPRADPPAARARLLYVEPGMTEESSLLELLRQRGWTIATASTLEHARRILREQGPRLDMALLRHHADGELSQFLAELRRDRPGLLVALQPTSNRDDFHAGASRTQIDLHLPITIRDRDAADTLAKLLRLP